MGPRGKGIYLDAPRLYAGAEGAARYARALRCSFAVVQTFADGERVAAACRKAALPVWLFSGPGAWLPETWRDTLARTLALAYETGARGFIADPEDAPKWLPRRAEAEQLRDALVRCVTELGLDVGLTTFPAHTLAPTWAHPRLWGSPQVYERSQDDISPAVWCERWSRMGWGRIVPSVRAYDFPTAAAQSAYLELIPSAQGVIVWDRNPLEGERLRVVANWRAAPRDLGELIRTILGA